MLDTIFGWACWILQREGLRCPPYKNNYTLWGHVLWPPCRQDPISQIERFYLAYALECIWSPVENYSNLFKVMGTIEEPGFMCLPCVDLSRCLHTWQDGKYCAIIPSAKCAADTPSSTAALSLSLLNSSSISIMKQNTGEKMSAEGKSTSGSTWLFSWARWSVVGKFTFKYSACPHPTIKSA